MNSIAIRVISLIALFAALGVSVDAQKPKAPAPKKVDQHKGTSLTASGTQTVSSDKPEMVTSAYIRMNHPEFLLHLAQQVKAGIATRTDLEKFTGPSYSQLILGQDLSPLIGSVKAHKSGRPNLRFGTLLGGHATSGGAHGGGGGPATPLPPTEYAPRSLSYKKLVPGVMETPSIHFTAPTDCLVTVFVSAHPDVFAPEMMESFKGTLGDKGPDGLSADVDQTAAPGQPLQVKAGQDCVLMLNVGAAKEGDYSTVITIYGFDGSSGAWEANIPITAHCSYSNGYSVHVQELDQLVNLMHGHSFAFHLRITPVNFSAPFNFQINWVPTDPGVNMNQQTIHVTSAKAFDVTFTGRCLKNSKAIDNSFYGTVELPDHNGTDVSILYAVISAALKFHTGEIDSGYNQASVVLIGDELTFHDHWRKPAVYVDSDGYFCVLDDIYVTDAEETNYPCPPISFAYDNKGNALNFLTIPFGMYFSKNGTNHGSYAQVSGVSAWIRDNWDDIVNGQVSAHIWFMPGQMAADSGGLLPQLIDGFFTLPRGDSQVLVYKW